MSESVDQFIKRVLPGGADPITYGDVCKLLGVALEECARLRAQLDGVRDWAVDKAAVVARAEAAEQECARLRADVETGARLWNKELTQRLDAEQRAGALEKAIQTQANDKQDMFMEAFHWRERARALEVALDRAAYALFQLKRMTPESVRKFAGDEHVAACDVLNALTRAAPANSA